MSRCTERGTGTGTTISVRSHRPRVQGAHGPRCWGWTLGPAPAPVHSIRSVRRACEHDFARMSIGGGLIAIRQCLLAGTGPSATGTPAPSASEVWLLCFCLALPEPSHCRTGHGLHRHGVATGRARCHTHMAHAGVMHTQNGCSGVVTRQQLRTPDHPPAPVFCVPPACHLVKINAVPGPRRSTPCGFQHTGHIGLVCEMGPSAVTCPGASTSSRCGTIHGHCGPCGHRHGGRGHRGHGGRGHGCVQRFAQNCAESTFYLSGAFLML